MTNIGLGCQNFSFAVYIGNRPDVLSLQGINDVVALENGEIAAIGNVCGNGWRKVFNVYAKLLYALDIERFTFSRQAPSWQQYRDTFLLQQASKTALLFTPPPLEQGSNTTHIICGRTYANQLIDRGLAGAQLEWLDTEFAVDRQHRLFVCPYFDYRQLSNTKIERLADLLKM